MIGGSTFHLFLAFLLLKYSENDLQAQQQRYLELVKQQLQTYPELVEQQLRGMSKRREEMQQQADAALTAAGQALILEQSARAAVQANCQRQAQHTLQQQQIAQQQLLLSGSVGPMRNNSIQTMQVAQQQQQVAAAQQQQHQGIFSPEMNAFIRNGRFSRDSLARALGCDNAVRVNFDRKGYTAFCYVLIDPRVSGVKIEALTFETFVKSVFYIGKGTNSRPLQHFIDARNAMDKATNDQNLNKKLQTIVDIWSSGHGIPKIQFSHGVSDKAALIKEACMIDAVQVKNLTNLKRGEYHECAKTWDLTAKSQYGVWLLDK
ncbi:hypothetical protein GCK72_011529 [Caenorhabditis remanei]|uniref:GIY-YIG domain-containing protein n=1 Tax=Caenorhabditis remanei TaxID=31234 RepID=A0A6A5HA13_CAERE|nr:hypothetical protein GCK72_011529 [Caenorhabditis remanei]KAF1763263.1 hypothetical protein GCK72_011529 [Caenorhabditis remanei]